MSFSYCKDNESYLSVYGMTMIFCDNRKYWYSACLMITENGCATNAR